MLVQKLPPLSAAPAESIRYEVHRPDLGNGQQTTVHVVRYPLAHTHVRLLCFEQATRLDVFARTGGPSEMLNAGFYLRAEGRPLGELWLAGEQQSSVPFDTPFDLVRGAVTLDGPHLRIARRYDLAQTPAGDLLQAGPLLVCDGVAVEDTEVEGFSVGARQFDSDITVGRYPRAAIALNDTDILAVACEGRRSGLDVGMDLPELAHFLVEVGALFALNLDGGCSSTLIHRGHLLTRPYTAIDVPGEVREVWNAFSFESL